MITAEWILAIIIIIISIMKIAYNLYHMLVQAEPTILENVYFNRDRQFAPRNREIGLSSIPL